MARVWSYSGLTQDHAVALAAQLKDLDDDVTVEILFDPTQNTYTVQATYPDSTTPTPGQNPVGGQQVGNAPPPADGPPVQVPATTTIAWGRKVAPDFKSKVIDICGSLQCDPSYLMASIAFETGATFSPSIQNPRSGATGLIQFMPSTAAGLGTSTDALKQMDAVAQLDYVDKYLMPFASKMKSLSDVYMTILYPTAVGQPDSFVLFAKPSIAYEENAGLDTNNDGQVTKGEAASKVQGMLDTGLSVQNRG